MSKQSLTIRLEPEDIGFISEMQTPGSPSLSAKLGLIIEEARRRREELHDYECALRHVEELVAPAERSLRAAENQQEQHSELVARVTDWLPETLAFLLSAATTSTEKEADSTENLNRLERNLAERVFVLTESVLQLTMSDWNTCYDPQVLRERSASHIQSVRRITRALAAEESDVRKED